MAVTYTGVKTQASPQSPQPHKETPKPKQNKKKNKKMPKTKHKQTNKQTNKQDKRGDGSMDTLAFPVIVRMVCAGLHAHELRNKENKPTEETSKAVRQSKRLWGGGVVPKRTRFPLLFCAASFAFCTLLLCWLQCSLVGVGRVVVDPVPQCRDHLLLNKTKKTKKEQGKAGEE